MRAGAVRVVEAMRHPARVLLLVLVPVLLLGGAASARGERSTATSVTTHEAAPLETFTFVGGGDIALTGDADSRVFDGIRGYLRAGDLVVGNLEGTLTTSGVPKCSGGAGCFTFRGSPAWAAVLRRAGFNVLNVANNHALDYGAEGQSETLTSLREAGLLEQGLPGQVLHVSLRDTRIALIGCAPYGWAQSLLDIAASARLVRNAARAADVVIVYMHAGAEGSDADHVAAADELYLGESRGNSRAFAHAMIRAGADLVFGSGPHVLRGIEWYRNRLIAYSLGNLAGTHTLSTAGSLGSSALLRATLDERGNFLDASVVPLRLAGGGTPVPDAGAEVATRIRALSHADFGARAIRISATGRLAAPDHTHLWTTSFSR
jgi:poly-gamma-glutamate capsule biosynthesis protein CapA/YwtB (metallophosphatase superfamily)